MVSIDGACLLDAMAYAEPGPAQNRWGWIVFGLVLAVLGGLLFAVLHPAMTSIQTRITIAYGASLALGAAVGATELIARYRDRPTAALGTVPAGIYMLVNGAASLGMFWLLFTHRLPLSVTMFQGHDALSQLFLAGFSSMALFRSSLFNVRVADQTVGVGPAAVLQVILRVADREVDRQRAGPRAARIGRIMRGVVYQRARDALPLHCYSLMQNVGLDEQNNLEQSLALLEKRSSLSDEGKAYYLGLLLMNLVGEDVLTQAVAGLGGRIKGPVPDDPAVLSRAKELAPADLPALLAVCRALEGPRPVAPGSPPMDAAAKATADRSFDDAMIAKPDGSNGATLGAKDHVVIALTRLRTCFGPETVSVAITSLLNARTGTEQQQTPTANSAFGPDKNK